MTITIPKRPFRHARMVFCTARPLSKPAGLAPLQRTTLAVAILVAVVSTLLMPISCHRATAAGLIVFVLARIATHVAALAGVAVHTHLVEQQANATIPDVVTRYARWFTCRHAGTGLDMT